MGLKLIMNLWILICSLGGSIYGIYRFYRPKKALFLKMLSGGVSCLMFTELFMVIYMVTQGDLEPGFHVGMLGIIGSFMYLFSANYGQMDGLVDNRKKEMLPTRLKAFAAPLIILLLYALFCVLVDDVAVRIPVGIVTAFIIPCAYYNFKHIIIYDVKLGIIRQLRMYNILAFAYAVLTMLNFIGLYANIVPLYIVSSIGIGLIAATILPVLKRGVDKWIM